MSVYDVPITYNLVAYIHIYIYIYVTYMCIGIIAGNMDRWPFVVLKPLSEVQSVGVTPRQYFQYFC